MTARTGRARTAITRSKDSKNKDITIKDSKSKASMTKASQNKSLYSRRRQDAGEGLCNTGLEAGGEDDVELDDESPLLEGVPVLRHALPPHHLQVASLYHLA